MVDMEPEDEFEEPEHRFMEPLYRAPGAPVAVPDSIANRHSRRHRILNRGNYAASAGIMAAQTATGAPGAAAVVVGGATVAGAGPIGLLAAAAALTVGSTVQAGRTTYRTTRHLNDLNDVLRRSEFHQCSSIGGGPHTDERAAHVYIRETVLPYIIAKKRAKRIKSGISTALPGVGSVLVAGYSIPKSAKKRFWNRNKGDNRTAHAQRLAEHHCRSNCSLTHNIIRALFFEEVTNEEIEALRDCPFGDVAAVLTAKIKSS